MKRIRIIGKNRSVENWQVSELLGGVTTIGLNQAALVFPTDYAITAHQPVMRAFVRSGRKNLIACLPFVDGSSDGLSFDFRIGHKCGPTANHEEDAFEAVVHGNSMHNYRAFWTVLHLAIWWAAIQIGRGGVIEIVGCELTPDSMTGFDHYRLPHQVQRMAGAKQFLAGQILALEKQGVRAYQLSHDTSEN